jgi:hypothetical protein
LVKELLKVYQIGNKIHTTKTAAAA